MFDHDPAAQSELRRALVEPSLYDEVLRFLARRGHAVPAACLERDFSRPHERTPELVPVFKRIYERARDFWPEYHLCEQLVDIEESFQLWRFRHMGLIHGAYDAKAEGFAPGGCSLHNSFTGHGPDAATFEKASAADTSRPDYIKDTMAFMFEARAVIRPTAQALAAAHRQRDYQACWSGLQKHFAAR